MNWLRSILILCLALLAEDAFGQAAIPGTAAFTSNPGVYSIATSLTPAATAAAIGVSEQTFTITGLATGQKVFTIGPAPTALCPMIGSRVSAANTIQLDFATLTAAACTPAAGTYTVVVEGP